MIITHHALERYCERVEPITLGEAEQRIRSHAPAIERAISFHAPTVKLGSGARLVLCGERVVTVLARGQVNRGHWVPLGERIQPCSRH